MTFPREAFSLGGVSNRMGKVDESRGCYTRERRTALTGKEVGGLRAGYSKETRKGTLCPTHVPVLSMNSESGTLYEGRADGGLTRG